MPRPLSATRNMPETLAESALSDTVPWRPFRKVNHVFCAAPPAAVVSRTIPPDERDRAMLAPSTATSFAPASGASQSGAGDDVLARAGAAFAVMAVAGVWVAEAG